MKIAAPLLVIVVLAALLMNAPPVAQTPAEDLSKIDQTLKQILAAMTDRNSQENAREDKRIMLQRLEIQSLRLTPLENERAEVRLRLTTIEKEIAEIQQKLAEIEDMRVDSEFTEMAINNATREYTRKFAEAQASQSAILTALARVEDEWKTERDTYDALAEAIDKKLGLVP